MLNNTVWFKDYWNGAARTKVGAKVDDTLKQQSLAKAEAGTSEFVINTQTVAQKSGDAGVSFVVTVAPKPSPSAGLARTAENTTR